ncbi:MAG: aldo/keto reductase [Acidipila sp.]|nr:aldo/keto reductase [Acidipila sp.]
MQTQKQSRRAVLKSLGGLCLAAAGARTNAFANLLAAPVDILTRRIPRTGEALPAIGLGSWKTFEVGSSPSERETVAAVMQAFTGNGGRLLDTAPMYSSAEEVIGDIAAQRGLLPRLFLATKVLSTGRAEGIRQMENSLRNLRTTRIDLLQVHNLVDTKTQLATLREWQQAGRVRYVGITHYTDESQRELETVMRTFRPDFIQANYSITDREAERRLLPAAAELGIAVMVNRPFEGGSLFDRVRGKALPDWAKEMECSCWAQVFLKFILAHPAVTCVIPATRNPQHALENMGANRGHLPDEKMREKMAVVLNSF